MGPSIVLNFDIEKLNEFLILSDLTFVCKEKELVN